MKMTTQERLIKHYESLGFLVPRLIDAPAGTSIRFDIENCEYFLAELIFQYMEMDNILCFIKGDRIRVAVNSNNEIFYIKHLGICTKGLVGKYYAENEKEIRKGTTGFGNEEISVDTLTFKDKRYSLIYRRY